MRCENDSPKYIRELLIRRRM